RSKRDWSSDVCSSDLHPVFGLVFTALLYLTIGPFFALPRTGAVSYEVGIAPFIGEGNLAIGLIIFSVIFYAISLWLSLNPSKLRSEERRVGKERRTRE